MCLFPTLFFSLSQEPLQEWAVGLLHTKEERMDTVQGEISEEQAEIFKATQENTDGEVALQGKESKGMTD